MRKKVLSTIISLTAFIALAVTPALAQATPTLVNVNNEPLPVGELFYLFGEDFTFYGGTYFGCDESEITAEVTENPGAAAEIVATRFEGGGPTVEGKQLCQYVGSHLDFYDVEYFEGDFAFSTEGKVTFDGAMKIRRFHRSSETEIPQLLGSCTYALKGDFYVTAQGDLSLEGAFGDLVSVGGEATCMSELNSSGEFEVADLNGELIELVE